MKQKPKVEKLSYYQKHKDDPAFKEHRNSWAREYRKKHPEIKEYIKKYHIKYYVENKEALKEKCKSYPDPTRNERVNRFKQKERETLGKAYIIQLFTRSGKLKKSDITPYMIAKRRKQILEKRAAKNNKS